MQKSIIISDKTEKLHRQGDLDGLCGIYTIVNSMSLLVPNKFAPSELFEKLLRSFGKNAASVVINGIHFHQMIELLKLTSKYMSNLGVNIYSRKACYVEPDTLAEFWNIIKMHVDSYGEGSAVLAIDGVMSHWTCVKKVHENSFEMADGTIKIIERKKTTIKSANMRRPIVLLPNQAILIKVVN